MITVLAGHCIDVLADLPEASIDCVVTSPPYWGLRDYGSPPVAWGDGWAGELGREDTPGQYVAHLLEVFAAVRRVLRPDGTMWVNLGDTYGSSSGPQAHGGLGGPRAGDQAPGRVDRRGSGVPPKSLVGVPWRFALAMIDAGWILRQDVIWAKPNPMPESVTDRCTKAHEYVFLFARSPRYYWDREAMREPAIWAGAVMRPSGARAKNAALMATGYGNPREGFVKRGSVTGETRNRRTVWSVNVAHIDEEHHAAYPPDLIRPMIRASCPPGGTVLDPFGGAGTTAMVAAQEGRRAVVIEVNPRYVEMIGRRVDGVQAGFGT